MGVATALRLAAAGANVALGDIDASRIDATAAQIAKRETGVLSLATDVTRRADVNALVERAVETFGRIDVMLNLAGIIHDARLADTDEADLERVLAVNVKGVYFGCQAAVSAMGDQGSGSIVNMASLAAFAPIPQLSAYAISKAGIVALTKVLAAEVSGAGIRVNAIAPGFVEGSMTRRHSLNPDGTVDEAKLEAERARARDHIPAAHHRATRGHRKRDALPRLRCVALPHGPGPAPERRQLHALNAKNGAAHALPVPPARRRAGGLGRRFMGRLERRWKTRMSSLSVGESAV